MASVQSQIAMDMAPNIAMEPVQSDIAPSPVAEAGVMMTIKSEFEIAAVDQSAQTAPSAEASVSMSIAPPPVAKQPPPEKKKAEKKMKKPAPKKVAEENFAAKAGKPQKSASTEKAAKIAAEKKKTNTKKTVGKNTTSALQAQKRTGLGGQGEVATKNSKGATARYNSIVRARLAASFRRGEGRGRVMISFTLHPDGRMSGGRVSRSSGSGNVDAAALSALRRTSFPAFLPGMPRKPKAFSIPMAIQ
jgi:protein TonB